MTIAGTTLIVLDGGPYYSPSFPRGGLAGTFAVDVTHLQGVAVGFGFDITVEHRDEHDTTWGVAGGFTTITTLGSYQVDIEELKQIIRFKYEFVEGDPDEGVHFVMQPPSFRPYP